MAKNGSAIRAMFEEGKKMAALYGKENVYDFSLGNPNTPPPECVREAKQVAARSFKKKTGFTSDQRLQDIKYCSF